MNPGTITAHDLGKRFTPHARPLTQLRRALWGTPQELADATWAFRHLSLDLPPGTGLGIIGRNGAGKSTLLAVLAGILQADEGRCACVGRVGTLLEIAAGFHPEFSGRENVELALKVAGLSTAEIAARIDAVKQFSAIGNAFEDPVRTYSSGMLLRAAYAQITAVPADVLLIDEVLAVGDALFQARCYEHLQSLRKRGVTRVLVSHDLSAILSQCDRVLVLDRGELQFNGDPAKAVDFYRREILAAEGRLSLADDETTRAVQITGLEIRDAEGRRPEQITPGQPLTFVLHLTAHAPVQRLAAGIEFHTPQGWMLGAVSTELTPTPLPDLTPGQSLTVAFQITLPFNPGLVNLHAGVTGQAATGPTSTTASATTAPLPFLDRRENIATLEIIGPAQAAYGAVRLTPTIAVQPTNLPSAVR
ncbi:MAG TPA: ABC transporter ATP-binding protein [Planctomycetota bacterium]|nr:ABC transporter ATP-binding protein [Planctomycetota bacterium]